MVSVEKTGLLMEVLTKYNKVEINKIKDYEGTIEDLLATR